jgi:hypothetical protein
VLFHISEEAGISRFDPRPSEYSAVPIVWAIDDDRLRNYLVPRECPRVAYSAGPNTTMEDRERFLGTTPAVVAIEDAWLERLRRARLFCYHLAADAFACLDECAGYFVSQEPAIPIKIEVIDDPIAELARRNVELRVMPNLWPLRDAVIESSLRFSIIRMRNAQPRDTADGDTPLSAPKRAAEKKAGRASDTK